MGGAATSTLASRCVAGSCWRIYGVRVRGIRLSIGCGCGLSLLAGVAHASNGVGQRTPPIFPRAECITSIDRSVDPVLHLDIGLARTDDILTVDEPPDSRRFQFFAFCEDEHPELLDLPNWVAQQDIDTSLELGLIDAPPPAEDVLASSGWAACAFPMNPADARIPITCEATEPGLDFDTSQLEAGNYVVRGYTYEPALNLWSTRRGVVSVHDGTPPPAVGLMTPLFDGRQVRLGDPFAIEGCTAGPAGMPVELQWASLLQLGGDDDEAQWRTFATLDAADGAFTVPFDPPQEAVNQVVLVRAVVDPSGPSRWVDHAEGTMQIFDDDGESDTPFGEVIEICGFYPPEEGSTGGLPGSDESSSSDAAGESIEARGCACAAGSRRPTESWLVLVALFSLVRRRRPLVVVRRS